jgi:microcystin-dependent protein
MGWASITYTFSPSTIAKSSEVNQNFTDCVNNVEKAAPTGSGKLWFTNTAPTGYLLCDGAAVSRATYARLFAVIGTQYGAGDGSTTFNLPDLKGRVPVGRDAGQTEFDALGEAGGEKTHILTEAEMPAHNHGGGSHSHGVSDPGHVHSMGITHGDQDGSSSNGAVDGALNTGVGYTGISIQSSGTIISTQGSGSDHNNLQPYTVVNFIIKD